LLTLLFSALLLHVEAQTPQNIVRGKVTDAAGKALAGVAVIEKGTQNGITTDLNGAYQLTLRQRQATLTFSMLGYTGKEMPVTGSGILNMTLDEETKTIDDVVVIGYGRVKSMDVTGAVGAVKSDVMEDRLVLSVSDALKGKLAGVNIVSTDGAPGAEMNIQIRGVNSINASSAPLYVIDGVLMESSDVSPAEIETIHILKDASSTAIYGSRGANGVVIITTKKGKPGKANVNVTSQLSWQKPVRLYEMANLEEWGKFQMYGHGRTLGNSVFNYYDTEGRTFQLGWPAGNNASGMSKRYQQILDGTYPYNTDWQQAMFQQALVQEYRVNISGGSDKDSYSLMGSYLNQDGIIIESGTRRYNLRANYNRYMNSTTQLIINVSGSSAFTRNVANNAIQTMLAQPPGKPLNVDEWETLENEQTTVNNNPVMNARNITDQTTRDNIVLKGAIDKMFSEIFRLNISGSYAFTRIWDEYYYPPDMNTGGGNTVKGKAQVNNTEKVDWLNENLLYITPKKHCGHAFDGLLGLTFQGDNQRTLNVETTDFAGFAGVPLDNLEVGVVPHAPANDFTSGTMMSGIARLNYSYKERYLLTASIRADGSSRLAKGKKWDYFPSGAFAWRMSEEPFMNSLRFISNWKWRFSAGVSGNASIKPYQTLPLSQEQGYPIDGVTHDKGISVSRTANPDLKWERTTQYDAGVDIDFLKSRISLVVDTYYKRTRDLLLLESVPTYLGYSNRWTNRGAVDNKGLEISINAVPVSRKNFSWNSQFNISFNRSKVVYINEMGEMVLTATSAGGATGFGILKQGEPLGTFYGYEDHGVWRSWSELEASGITEFFNNSGARPGWTKYVDQDGDHKVNENDRVILGYAQPKFTGGFTNSFEYKGIGLQIGLEFKYGGSVFNSTRMFLETGKGMNVNPTKRAAQYAYYPTLFYSDGDKAGQLFVMGNEDIAYLHTPVSSSEMNDAYCRTLYIEDGSYLRLNDITLSYTFPKQWVSKVLLKSGKVFVNVKNPFLWTKYSGFDPDVNSNAGANVTLMPGVDKAAYPRVRSISAGVNLIF